MPQFKNVSNSAYEYVSKLYTLENLPYSAINFNYGFEVRTVIQLGNYLPTAYVNLKFFCLKNNVFLFSHCSAEKVTLVII